MKKSKVAFFVALSLLSISGCNANEPNLGKFFTLQEAYSKELLTISDLESIAIYHNQNNEPENNLSDNVVSSIKERAAKDMRESKTDPTIDAKASGFSIFKYYGTYSGSVALILRNIYFSYPAEVLSEQETVANITFLYNSPDRIMVWSMN